jgi:hypothetical protein
MPLVISTSVVSIAWLLARTPPQAEQVKWLRLRSRQRVTRASQNLEGAVHFLGGME